MAVKLIEVTDNNFDQEVLQSDVPVLVDFWAVWCQPCKMIAPYVEALAEEYQDRLKVAKLNVDENSATAARYNIRGIPTLLLFKNGMIKEQIVGVPHNPKEHLAGLIEKHV